jgi:quercetin dioxygenase-like cupin family protein
MKTSIRRIVVVLVVAVAFVAWARSVTHAQQAPPAPVRKVLLQQDLTIPGYTAVLVSVEIPVGGREGRHTHPGSAFVHVEQGVLTLDYEGKPTMTYKAGESFYVEPGKIHEGINKGNAPIKAIAAFVVEKGKPLTTQVADAKSTK